MLLAFSPAALADAGSGDTSSSSTSEATTQVATETPATTTPATTTPATTTPATTTPATTTPITDGTPIVPGDGAGVGVPDVDTCAGCIPDDVDTCIQCVPGAAGGGVPHAVARSGALPFTGIEDTIAPLLLALTVVLGGVVAWRWAQLRESVAIDASRARQQIPTQKAGSGYAAALRLHAIDQRARRVYSSPRVA